MAPRKKSTPQQINFIKPMPEVKNGDILDVDQAAVLLKVSKKTIYNRVKSSTIPYARLGRKLLFNKQKLVQWVADGGDNAATVGGEPSILDEVADMLNSGKARVASMR